MSGPILRCQKNMRAAPPGIDEARHDDDVARGVRQRVSSQRAAAAWRLDGVQLDVLRSAGQARVLLHREAATCPVAVKVGWRTPDCLRAAGALSVMWTYLTTHPANSILQMGVSASVRCLGHFGGDCNLKQRSTHPQLATPQYLVPTAINIHKFLLAH